MKKTIAAAAFSAAAVFAASADEKVWLDELPLDQMTTGWDVPYRNMTVDKNPLVVGKTKLERGVGTHSLSWVDYKLNGNAISFEADVGIDIETTLFLRDDYIGSVHFWVIGDGKQLYRSPLLKAGYEPVHVKVDLAGVDEVQLFVDDGGDGDGMDHADWGNAFFLMKDGTRPETIDEPAPEQLGILTPPAGKAPRINGAKIFGVRPGHPIIWKLPVTGEKPLKLSAKYLPGTVKFDREKGILTGFVRDPGTYEILFTAKNAHGEAKEEFKLVVGDTIALTPPMGWSSWNCFASKVSEQDIRNAIDVFVDTDLVNHGWSYVNIDDFWQNRPIEKEDESLMGPERTPEGEMCINKRFSDMKALTDYAHSKGVKMGIYSSPGEYTCAECTGSWGHEWQDAATFAKWGFDYLKYDWCFYKTKSFGDNHSRWYLPYRLMGEALKAQDRDIVYSLCQYGMGNVSTWGELTGGNCWRTTIDITDTWLSVWTLLGRQAEVWPYAHPGAWNDPDMLVIGRVGWLGWGEMRDTGLTPNEQYTHISMWAMVCSPLLIGCDMTKFDDFTLGLLTNDEVIEVSQDELGAAAARVLRSPRAEVWAKPMVDGSVVLGLFNTYRQKREVRVDLESLGFEGGWRVRDLWRQTDEGVVSGEYSHEVFAHATHLVRLFPEAGAKLTVKDVRENSIYTQFEEFRPVGKPGYKAPRFLP